MDIFRRTSHRVLAFGVVVCSLLATGIALAEDDPLLNPPPRTITPTRPTAQVMSLPQGAPQPLPTSLPGKASVDTLPTAPQSLPGTAAVPNSLPPVGTVPSASPATPGTPATGSPDVPAAPCTNCEKSGFDFSKVPNVKPMPPGFNFPQPMGPGYYTFLDVLQGNYRTVAPKYGYTRNVAQQQPFYDADFRYLDDPNNTDHAPTDFLKRIKIGDNWMFSTGGQAWNRYMDVMNQGLGSKRSVEDLTRVRTYGDLWYKDQFRIYVEFIAATSIWQDVPAGPNDINKADFLNLFIDWKLFDLNGKPVYARLGRQEMILGSQRLVSNIDFLNTRRTFQGARGTYRGEDWDFDAWWLRPILINPSQLDSWDDKQNFAGAFTTYHPNKTDLIDMYYMYLDNSNSVTQLGLVRAPTTLHTMGARYTGNNDGFLWDFEGAVQLGSVANENLVAGFATTGLGYNWKDAPWNPTAWLMYDYASGDHSPGSGSYNTFNPLFPFGHNYFGGMDLIGRQNIHDLNMHVTIYPTPWLSLWTQYHELWLDSKYDALYNPAGVAIRRSPTGAAGNYVGSELNFVGNIHLTQNQAIQFGYGHLFGGGFLRATGSSQIDYTYVTYNIKW